MAPVLDVYSNMYVPHHFVVATSTYDTQSIDITSTSGEVCVVCSFSTNTKTVVCEIHYTYLPFKANILL